MQIGAINSINFKGCDRPGVINPEDFEEETALDLGQELDKFDKAADLAMKLVDGEDIKNPAEAAVAIGYAGAKTFTKGAVAAWTIDGLFNNKISELFERGLKGLSKGAKSLSSTLLSNEGKRFSQVANLAGDLLEKAEVAAKQAYKTVSKSNPAKGLAVAFGALSLSTFFPALLKKDGNEDGVADIMQKSQNVYAESSQRFDKLQEKASVAAEIMQLLS